MSKEKLINKDATVLESLPNNLYRVKLNTEEGLIIIAYRSGKMNKGFIKIIPGDKVKLEISPYGANKARIVYRYKK